MTRRLLGRMLVRGESFWDVVYAPFLAHDLTRQQLRDVIQAGLEQCQGRYNALTELFNMPKRDYRRFLGALKKFDCLVSAPVGTGAGARRRSGCASPGARAPPRARGPAPHAPHARSAGGQRAASADSVQRRAGLVGAARPERALVVPVERALDGDRLRRVDDHAEALARGQADARGRDGLAGAGRRRCA